jgi:hypothetical protein
LRKKIKLLNPINYILIFSNLSCKIILKRKFTFFSLFLEFHKMSYENIEGNGFTSLGVEWSWLEHVQVGLDYWPHPTKKKFAWCAPLLLIGWCITVGPFPLESFFFAENSSKRSERLILITTAVKKSKHEFWCRRLLLLLNQNRWWTIGRFTTKKSHIPPEKALQRMWNRITAEANCTPLSSFLIRYHSLIV